MRKIVLRLSERTVFWLSVVLMGFLAVVSLISTTYFNTSDFLPETPRFRMDNILLNVISAAVFAAVVYIFCKIRAFEKIKTEKAAIAAALFVLIIGIIWINVSGYYPASDQASVSRVAYLASQGDFKQFEAGAYMQVYPNQLGLVALLEIIYRITGGENWVIYQYITAVSNAFTVYLLYKITHRLFNNKKTDLAVIFLSAVCAQMLFYTTYVYGISLGLAFALAAFYFQLKFNENEKIVYAVLSAVMIGLSVLIKNNYSIFLVAMVILSICRALEKKKFKSLLAGVSAVVCCAALSMSLTAVYEVRTGEEIGSGMPKILWVAMGMQEGERAEGWYNGFNYDTYTESGADAEVSSELAKEAISERLSEFAEDPLYALQFYYKKTVSQWNEPTYESIWANQFHSGDFGVIMQSIYEGKLYTFLNEYMNIYQLVVFAAVLFSLVIKLRQGMNLEMERLFLPMVVIGGFIFHLVWEAKSGYIYPYFMCMLPAAAAGISEGGRILEVRVIKKKDVKNGGAAG